jgi:tetratricopeptide (TPR) repeat protein
VIFTKNNYYLFIALFFLFIIGITNNCFGSEQAAYEHNESGLSKLRAGNYEGAISDLRQANRYLPASKKIKKNLAVAYNNYAFSLMEKGRLKLAAEQFERSLSYDKDNPYALYNLGQVYYRIQEIAKAEKYLKRAYSLKPALKGLKKLYKKVEGEAAGESSFENFETAHFFIASAPDLPLEQFSYIRIHLEEAYGRIGMFLDHYPKDKVVVILYSESSYKRFLKNRPHWAMAVFDGKMRIPVNKVDYSDQDILKIIYHEYAHAVLRDITADNCPLWLSEGVAGFAEGFVSKKKKSFYKAYLDRFGVISIGKIPSDFTSKDLKIATWLYVQSYLLVDFIVKRKGYSGLRKILDYLGKGKDVNQSIEAVFGKSLRNFEREWVAYLKSSYGIQNLKQNGLK